LFSFSKSLIFFSFLLFNLIFFLKADQLISQWYIKANDFSLTIPSELSLFQQIYFEQSRKSSEIPRQLLKYRKIEFYQNLFFFIFLIFFQNYFISFLIIFIYLFIFKTNEEESSIDLPELIFNE